MKTDIIIKDSFSVIGIEGSTHEGQGFIQKKWAEANARFAEISGFAVKDAACWGLMSDFSRGFNPWENGFSQGLYLAGIECSNSAQAEGWTVWTVPASEYLRVECENGYPFREGLEFLEKNGYKLVGAAYDSTDLSTGKSYIYFPIRRL